MIFLPVLLLGWMIFGTGAGLMGVFQIIIPYLYMFLLFFIGYWGFVNYYLRYVFGAIYLAAIILTLTVLGRFAAISVDSVEGFKRIDPLSAFLLGIVAFSLLYLFIRAALSRSAYENPVKLAFPLKNGKYYIFEGGNSKLSRFMNYHFAGGAHRKGSINKTMVFAVDIAKLNSFGSFATGFCPKEPEKYEIFNEPVFSPCDGTVIEVVEGLENEIPFSGKHPYNVGNRIVIRQEDVNILLGHLQAGSLLVKAGEKVTAGQQIAQVGNSGLTEFPHLHMQAMKSPANDIWNGDGVAMEFSGKFFVKNNILSVPVNGVDPPKTAAL
jgi:hypothetical protein